MKGLLLCLALLGSVITLAQSPGIIVRVPNGSGVTALNPNGDSYSSATTAGFTTNDITQSEIPFFVVPPAIIEPTGDLATGPSGGFTDIVKTVDGSGFYMYASGGNLFFRLRIGGIISGSKGYSVLFDTDGRMGNSGPAADPNFIAPTNTSNGNPGFEYEVVLQTNFQVAVYNVDGSSNPGSPVNTYTLATNSQISAALSTDGNNPDYFYDWYVPLTAIGSPASFRTASTTVTSPSSALQGSRSDIYGIDDATSSAVAAWTTAVITQPTITLTSISSGGSGVGASCTAAPTINSPINTGSNVSVSGTWTRLDASKPSTATITLYKNGVSAGTTTVASGATWSINVTTVAPSDVFFARAQSSGESQCLQSSNVVAGCTSIPLSPTITCASTKGITGTIPLGTTVSIYQVSTSNNSPTTTSLTTGLTYTNNASDQTFNYFGTNPQSGNACQGQNGILPTNTTYMLIANNNGCLSAPTFICITGSSQNSWNLITSNAIALTTPVYPFQTSISGTGATSGQLLRLFVNNQYVTAITASASAFTFTGLSLAAGDDLKIYAQASGACMTVSSSSTVSCYTQPPAITTNSAGNLLTTATSISGTSTNIGATVNLYRGVSPSGTLVGTTTVAANGGWQVTGLTLSGAETYYATQTVSGCVSPASAAATVLGVTSVCPSFGAASYLENVSAISGSITSFTGTVRLYLDGTLIGSTSLTSNTAWSIPVNTTYSNTLYTGGVLTVTAQSAGNAESVCGSTATVTCSSPTQPGVSPLSSTINIGQSVTFNVTNVVSNTWYAALDNSGASYASSVYTNTSSAFNLTTRNFSAPGTYTLNISADKLTGCAKSFVTATITVNNVVTPVQFINVNASSENGFINIVWTVTNEVDVKDYLVEESWDGVNFQLAGVVPYHEAHESINTYRYQLPDNGGAEKRYFRIKQTDTDGNFMISKTVHINGHELSNLLVSPNPATGYTAAQFYLDKTQTIVLSVATISGANVYSTSYNLSKGKHNINLNANPLRHGVYLVILQTISEKIVTKLIVL